jgi:hypothetical protein
MLYDIKFAIEKTEALPQLRKLQDIRCLRKLKESLETEVVIKLEGKQINFYVAHPTLKFELQKELRFLELFLNEEESCKYIRKYSTKVLFSPEYI